MTYDATGLPRGLAIDPGTGIISGTPEETGTFNPTVRWPGHGNCDMGVQPETWHHGEALPAARPGEGCER